MNKLITTLIVVGIVFGAGLVVQTSFAQERGEPREPPRISDRCTALTAAHTAVPGAHADAWLASGICHPSPPPPD